MSGRLANALLLVAGTLAAAVVAEAAFRAVAFSEDRGWLSPDRELPPDPLPEHPAALGTIIRRSTDPLLLYDLRPNLRVIYETARVTTGPDGTRNPSPPVARAPGTVRIVGIGDSFMFGFGVGDQETYLARLESAVNSKHPPCRLETVNLAVPGYNGVMEVRSMDLKGLRYRPDVVLMEFISNDLDLPNFVWHPRDVWSLRRSFAAEFVRERVRLLRLGRRARDPVPLEPAEMDPGSGAQRFEHDASRVSPDQAVLVGWDSYERAVRHLAQVAKSDHFQVVLMGWDVAPEEPRVRDLAASLGFHVLNLGPRVRKWLARHGYEGYAGSPLSRRGFDAHPSALGHAQIATWLESFLEDEGLIGGESPCAPSSATTAAATR